MSSGPPYRPSTWALGGLPEKKIDIPVTAVFLFLFLLGAATHMTIYQTNRKRQHKFLFSLFIFMFCMSRVGTNVLRIASIAIPTNINLAIAAQIFVAAGVLILFLINLLFAQRILRSLHPNIGWHPVLSLLLKLICVLIGLTLAIVITATVQALFTLTPRTRTIDRGLQLYGATFLAAVSFLPVAIVLLALAIPRKSPPDKFGAGRLRTQIIVVLIGSILCCLGAAFRCGTSWKRPVPLTQPRPGYYNKGCFYVFNFTVEILVVYMYAIMRIDLRFWIPNGARGPGSYAISQTSDHVEDGERKKSAQVTVAGEDNDRERTAQGKTQEEHSNEDFQDAREILEEDQGLPPIELLLQSKS